MVAGDHDGADAGGMAGGDGGADRLPRRVHHADQSAKHEVALDLAGLGLRSGGGMEAAERHAQHPHAVVGQLFVVGEEPPADVVGQGHDAALVERVGGQLQQAVGRAFHGGQHGRGQRGGQGVVAFFRAVERGHALAVGIEREFCDPRQLRAEGLRGDAETLGGEQQGRFGGIADRARRLAGFLEDQMGVVAERGGQKQRGDLIGIDVVRQGGGGFRAGEGYLAMERAQAGHGHAVFRQRAGLVGADDGDGTEGFDGRQLADQRMALEHPAAAQRQRGGDDGRQAFWHHGDEQADGGQQHVAERLAAEQTDREQGQRRAQSGDGEVPAHLRQLALKRGAAFRHALDHAGDLTQFRAHAGSHHDAAAPALGDEGAHVREIRAVAQRQVRGGQRLGLFPDRFRFAGERGFHCAELDGVEQAQVGGHDVAGFKPDDVAGHQLPRGEFLQFAVAADAHARAGQLLEGGHGLLGAVFLDETQHAEQHDDGQNGDGLGDVAEEQGQNRCADENEDHGLDELGEEHPPSGPGNGFPQFVGAVDGAPGAGFGGGEPVGRGVQVGEDFGGGLRVRNLHAAAFPM